jgi:anti-sigma regulatory factor (Ser/Thr protein kinase)
VKAVAADALPVGEDGITPEVDIQAVMALDGDGADIARARHLAAGFLTRVQAEHGLPVSQRAFDLTRLVVSELVTNALKYAPGPVLLDLRILGDLVEVVVWDSDPALPVARAADAGRVGQHGLEIVMAVAQGFEAQREPVGKRITVRLALADDPDGAVNGRSPL